jgi:outer membrane receptor for monomeric catechols
MDERSGVADRDDVFNTSYGIAPTIGLRHQHADHG